MNQIWQLTLRLAYRLAVCYWFVFRPTTQGAYVAVWVNDQLLIVRNSYKRRFTIPSGGVGASETFLQAATRELSEEVGIVCGEDQLVRIDRYESQEEFKKDTAEVFELRLQQEPDVRIDQREVVFAKFCSLQEALELPTVSIVSQYLESVRSKLFANRQVGVKSENAVADTSVPECVFDPGTTS